MAIAASTDDSCRSGILFYAGTVRLSPDREAVEPLADAASRRLVGTGNEELARVIVDWAIVDPL